MERWIHVNVSDSSPITTRYRYPHDPDDVASLDKNRDNVMFKGGIGFPHDIRERDACAQHPGDGIVEPESSST
jgi:hypothetical protein